MGESLKVMLGERSYSIVIGRGVLKELGRLTRELGFSGRATVVTNPRVGSLYREKVTKSLVDAGIRPLIVEVPDGESYKTLTEVSKIYDKLLEEKLERSDPIIALGGGVIGDMAGFVAATYLRGVPYIQIPTTLLAQVDSSVGGKTGVNHPLGKNLIGAFYQPRAVYIDPDVLGTLEERDYRAGLAEVVKYGVIWDSSFFEWLEGSQVRLSNPVDAGDELIEAIRRSCEIKAEIVGSDEREQSGLRAILNFGHTFAHAYEALCGYGSYRHGEAVALGMVMAARLSSRLELCNIDTVERIARLLGSFGLETTPPELNSEELIEVMLLDKKVKGGRLRFVLTEGVGSVKVKDVSREEIKGFLNGL